MTKSTSGKNNLILNGRTMNALVERALILGVAGAADDIKVSKVSQRERDGFFAIDFEFFGGAFDRGSTDMTEEPSEGWPREDQGWVSIAGAVKHIEAGEYLVAGDGWASSLVLRYNAIDGVWSEAGGFNCGKPHAAPDYLYVTALNRLTDQVKLK